MGELTEINDEGRIKDFAEASADWFWESDADLNITMVSAHAANFDYHNLTELRYAFYGENTVGLPSIILQHQKFSDFIVQSRDDKGKMRYLRICGKPIFTPDGTFSGYRGSGRDVSDVIALTRRAEYQASHDELTGLPNRALFRQRLEHAILKADRMGQQILLLFLDLDHFKQINDRLGHDAGDQLLIQAAKRISKPARSTDVLCRLGGDEFVMIMENASPQDGHRLLREILSAFATPFQLNGEDCAITVSIGVSIYPDDATDPETLLRYADMAMYRAKQNGRNDFEFYTANLNHVAHQWQEIEQGLRQALEEQQLFMLYQPQVDVASGELVGLEALLRWRHPERGLIPPLEFIKIAEQSSLINEIGQFVLESVCKQLRAWSDADLKFPRVWVNISARNLRSATFREMFEQTLRCYHIPYSWLGVEITGHTFLDDTDEVRKNMMYLKETGLSVTLGDFGAGSTPLLSLKRLPVHAVKIGQPFVTGAVTNQDDRAVIKAIAAMSDALGFGLIGEGVETQQQSEMLIEGGCRIMQGFYYSPPLSPAELTPWIHA